MPTAKAGSPLGKHIAAMRQAVQVDSRGHLGWGRRLRYWNTFATTFPDATYRYDVYSYLLLKHLLPYWKENATASSTEYFRALMRGGPQSAIELFRRSLLGDESATSSLCQWRKDVMERHWDCQIEDLASSAVLFVLVPAIVRVEFPDHVEDCFDFHREKLEFYGEIDVTVDEQLFRVDDLDSHLEIYHFDLEYSAEYAVSIRGENEFDISARRTFWLTWLNEILPCVQGTAEEVRQVLEAR